jgi:hypothetical protein
MTRRPNDHQRSGAPKGTPSIVSRLITAAYWQRQCGLLFPADGHYTYGSSTTHHPVLTVADVNRYTDGWKIPAKATAKTRLIWTNGEFDPWRTSGVSSPFRPGGPLVSSPDAPVQLIPDGFHCSDMLAHNGIANAGVQLVIDREIAQIKTWVAEWGHYEE